jgi:predicted PurR-regulated permease PerM
MLAFDRRAAAITWTVGLVLLGFYLAYAVRRTIFLFVLAVFLAYMIVPLVHLLLKHVVPLKSRRTLATGIVFAFLGLLLAGLLSIAGPRVTEEGSRFAEQLPSLVGDGHLLDRIPLPDWLAPYRSRLTQFLHAHAGDATANSADLAKRAGKLVLVFGESSLFFVLIPILAFMMIVNTPVIRERLFAWLEHHPHEAMWKRIVGDLDTLLGGYIRALLILAFATIASYSIAFSIGGVPYALLLALLAGLLEFIPVLGPLAAALLCLGVAGASGYDHLLWIAGFIVVYRVFQDYVLNPYLMSNGVAVPALLVLFGLLAGQELAGIAGVFLSTPVLAAILILAQRIGEESRARKAPPKTG